jgi:hypothetical protein
VDVLVDEIVLKFGNADANLHAFALNESVIPKSRTDIDDKWTDTVHQYQLAILTELASNLITSDQKIVLPSDLFLDQDFAKQTTNDSAYRAYKGMWGNGPLIPLFAEIKIKNSQGIGVADPKSLSGVKLLWDWQQDASSNKHLTWGDNHQQDRTKNFLKDALDFMKSANDGHAPINSDNCHHLHGGKRGKGAELVFPEYDPNAYSNEENVIQNEHFPFKVSQCTNRKWASYSEPRTEGFLSGYSGVLFQPSRMSGDCYTVSVYLALEDDSSYDHKDADLTQATFEAPCASTGEFEVIRQVNSNIIRKENSVHVPALELVDINKIKAIFKSTGIKLIVPPPQIMNNARWQLAIDRASDDLRRTSSVRTWGPLSIKISQQGPFGLEMHDIKLLNK